MITVLTIVLAWCATSIAVAILIHPLLVAANSDPPVDVPGDQDHWDSAPSVAIGALDAGDRGA